MNNFISKIWILNETIFINNNGSLSFECSFCNNHYDEEEGFNINTTQYAGCDDYDRKEPERRKEIKRLQKWKEEYGHIPYSPGDPTY